MSAGEELVSVDSIKTAPFEPVPKERAAIPGIDPLTGSRDGKLDQHLGRIGGFIGGGPEKAGNIAYVVIIASIIMIVLAGCAGIYVANDKIAIVFDRLLTGAFALITGALGYLFGSSKDSK
ncbi:hypothetical protein [Mesorhizobium sp. M0678]|uniref:hypothetical protein n=1 Tax=Mesorhizobium sp. M0678 TaxID=2956985 RepID=UPI0033366B77